MWVSLSSVNLSFVVLLLDCEKHDGGSGLGLWLIPPRDTSIFEARIGRGKMCRWWRIPRAISALVRLPLGNIR